MDEEAVKRGRKREKETCQNIMTTVKLDRLHSAGMLIVVIFSRLSNNLVFHNVLAHVFTAFTKYGNLGPGLALPFLLSLFQIRIRGLGWSGSWQRSHLVSLLPAQAAGGV